MTATVNFSELSNKPKDTVRKLERSPSRSLLVRRRGADEEDLVLTTASRAAQASEASSVVTKLFIALVKHDGGSRAAVAEVVPIAFPWVRYLPEYSRADLVEELIDAVEGADSLDNPAPVAQVIAEWRHTAEAYADPEILAILTSEGEDFGPVPAPEAP